MVFSLLIRLLSALRGRGVGGGLRASQREGVETQAWGARAAPGGRLTSAPPRGIPDTTGCQRSASRRQGRGALRLRAQRTGLPGESGTLQSLGERLPATAARGRRGRAVNLKPPRAARRETPSPTGVGVERRRAGTGRQAREPREMETALGRTSGPVLTVRVALLPDPIHSAVGVDAQEEASVFAVQPLRILEVAGREGAAAAVLRQGGQRGDAPGCHGPTRALPGSPSPWSRAGSRRRRRRRPPAPASDALRSAAPAPAPPPPAPRHAAAPAGPQPRAVWPLRSPPALELRVRAGFLGGRHSRQGRLPKLQRPGSACNCGL